MWTDARFIVGALHDETWRDLTSQLIEIGFYAALRERTVAGILEDLRSHQVDLIFSEVELEDGNIFQLAQAVSDHEPSGVVPLVMIGDNFDAPLLENASNAGVDFVLERPFQRDQVETIIRGALGEQ